MPRPKRVDRPVRRHIQIPESVIAEVEILLFSELEGRVPHGAWSGLVDRLLRDWLKGQKGQQVAV